MNNISEAVEQNALEQCVTKYSDSLLPAWLLLVPFGLGFLSFENFNQILTII